MVAVPHLTIAADGDWRSVVEGARAGLTPLGTATVVAHSNSGLLLPAIARGFEIERLVFVDARLPPPSGTAELAEEPFLSFVRGLPRSEGRLLPWSHWWGEETMRELVPDDDARSDIEADMPSIPLAYLENHVDVPAGWQYLPCTYVRFSEAYLAEEAEARRRGWPVTVVAGRHLHMVVDPVAVTTAIL
jgi:hypothetical protein